MTSATVPNASKSTQAWPFPQSRRVGSTVYVGLQTTTQPARLEAGKIHDQTHHAFSALVGELEKHGASMKELTKLHTYYVYQGEGRGVTDYWEDMTSVRLKYLADPGPAATALRTKGVWSDGALIGVDGIAELEGQRIRIMPEHAWDWSIPTPFSQGWLVGDRVYVGGQISADRAGKAVAPGEVGPQTVNTMAYIHSVLKDAGADWADVLTLKVAYQHSGDEEQAKKTLDAILAEVNQIFPEHRPVLVAFGVDLLYEGLLLEIDAIAIKGGQRQPLRPADYQNWADARSGFTPGWKTGNDIFIGGLSAPGAASLEAQTEATMSRVSQVLAAGGGDYSDLVKLNVYVSTDDAAQLRQVASILDGFLTPGKTVVSILRVAGLPWPGQRIQIDGLAVLNQPN